MMKSQLGRLQRVSAREVFGHEALDFTPWLAGEENLRLLSEALSISLALESVEQPVGMFRADLLCRNQRTEQRVLIENQLERTDHIHLGQLLTYAAGLDASTIVWIAGQFTDEHRTTLDWLNGVSSQDIQFVGVEIEFWQIGQSEIAPKFNVLSASKGIKRTETTKQPATRKVSYSVTTKKVSVELSGNSEKDQETLMSLYPNIQQWLEVDQRSVTVDEIVAVTKQPKRRVLYQVGRALKRTPRNENKILVDSVISWLKVAPVPACASQSDSQNGHKNGHAQGETPLDLPELEVVG